MAALKRPTQPESDDLTDEVFNAFRKYIYSYARISLGENKRELIRARFGKIIRRRGMSGFQEYLEWVAADKSGEAVREVMNAIATNLTSFFRENQHFEFLGGDFLSALAKKAEGQPGKPKLRGWSAGCSTGEEVYTMAITITENLPNPENWDVKLLATDIDTDVVAHGQRGVYQQARLSGVSPARIKKYFDPCMTADGKPAYQVKAFLRRMVAFRHLNLFSEWPFKNKFDFIFCCNVMIYFDRQTQEQLVNRYYQQLSPGGALLIGHSESLTGVKHSFDYAQPTVYIKKA